MHGGLCIRHEGRVARVGVSREMKRYRDALFMGLPQPVPEQPVELLKAICACAARSSGREVRLMLEEFPPGSVTGLWLDMGDYDLIVLEANTSPLHQVVILGHELWHLKEGHCGHGSAPARWPRPAWWGTAGALPTRSPTSPPVRSRTSKRSGVRRDSAVCSPTGSGPAWSARVARHHSAEWPAASGPRSEDDGREGVNLYIPAAALGIVLAVKLPSLVRRRRSPMVRSVNAVIFLQAAAFFFSAPPTITVVNEMSGVSNFSAVLVYCILSAYACACRVLMENWREDVEVLPHTRRRVRRWIWGHGVVTILLIGCFALGEAPVERQRDFETYYANTPFMREMVLLCLLAVTAAAAAAAAACWNWARDIRRECPQRKTGRRLAAHRAHRPGRRLPDQRHLRCGQARRGRGRLERPDWEPLNRAAVSFACLGTLLIAVGFLIPIVGPWITARVFGPLWTLRSLGPLRRTLCRAGGPRGPVRLSTPWNAGPGRRLTDRMTDIHDRMLELGAYCSEGVRADAYARAREGGSTEAESVALGLAAMFTAAADARALAMPADKEQGVVAVRALRAAEAEYRDLLVGISRALPALAVMPHGAPAGAADSPSPDRHPSGHT